MSPCPLLPFSISLPSSLFLCLPALFSLSLSPCRARALSISPPPLFCRIEYRDVDPDVCRCYPLIFVTLLFSFLSLSSLFPCAIYSTKYSQILPLYIIVPIDRIHYKLHYQTSSLLGGLSLIIWMGHLQRILDSRQRILIVRRCSPITVKISLIDRELRGREAVIKIIKELVLCNVERQKLPVLEQQKR